MPDIRGVLRARDDLSPSENISYKRHRGEQQAVGLPIIKFENLLPPTPPTPPSPPQADAPQNVPPPQPPRNPADPVVCDNVTWHQVKSPVARDLHPYLNIPAGRPSERVTPVLGNIVDLFFSFMPQAEFDKMTTFTNRKMGELRLQISETNRGSSSYEDTTPEELMAYVACLIFSGERKDNHMRTLDLFDNNFGLTFYASLFSRKRFEFLCRCIRFDDIDQRVHHINDKFRHIRELWETVMNNCNLNYIPGPFLTVDEQLQRFFGRCPFKTYLPSKPAKYGIKVFMVCDAQTHYCINGLPYLGAGGHTDKPDGMLYGTHFTLKLVEPIPNVAGRVVCCDNWFTSLGLVQKLQLKGLGCVGTIRKKPTMPLPTVQLMNIPEGEVVALFNHEMGVNVVYLRRPKQKYVAIITTVHNAFSYVENMKTEAHMFYNASKGGVDTFDQMCATTDTSRKTNRWPQCVFYNLINLIMNNAFICHSSAIRPSKDRHIFNSQLAHLLAKPFASWRLNVRGQRLQGQEYIRVAIECIFRIRRDGGQQQAQPAQVAAVVLPQPAQPVVVPDQPAAVFQRPNVPVITHTVATQAVLDPRYPGFLGNRKKADKRKRCLFGPRGSWSGFLLCAKCEGAVCNNHSAILCPNCFPYDFQH